MSAHRIMQTVFQGLLSASLVLHAALGCCLNHVHDQSHDETPIALAEECCNHDHDSAPHGQHSQCPCKGHSHCHGLCNYLPGQKSLTGKWSPHLVIDFAIDSNVQSTLQVAALHSAPQTGDSNPPPLRLHLLHQILLI